MYASSNPAKLIQEIIECDDDERIKRFGTEWRTIALIALSYLEEPDNAKPLE